MRILTALFFVAPFVAAAQSPQVPHKMAFAGMTLTIRDDARREIQKDVDALTQSPRHYNIKAERAKTYFPIMEKIFAEEGVPDDFKYLALQESALIADAVSVSNAVGFWQFKDFTALEMGLRVDKEIDERLNIASSTRGAARYIKKNNTFFNNWIYALQAYQMGAGGVLKSEKGNHSGETHAEITSDTYWYVKKFLAHKIAYEEGVKGKGQVEVTAYEIKSHKTLAELSKELSVDEIDLKAYNKWAKTGVIPGDRTYIVLVPGILELPAQAVNSIAVVNPSTPAATEVINSITVKDKINGIEAIQAMANENAAKLATRAGVDLTSFLKWNEISYNTALIPGTFYFLGKKRSRASQDYHTIKQGENLWTVSQKYGVKLKKLKKYNRLESEALKTGTTLWLTSLKPKSAANQPLKGVTVEVNDQDTFNWTSVPEDKQTTTSISDTPNIQQQVNADKPALITGKEKEDSLKMLSVVKEEEQDVSENNGNQDTTQIILVVAGELPKTEHIVQVKETLYGIAILYNVGVMDLVNWNNLDIQQGIKPGQVLKLSDGQSLTKTEAIRKEEIHEVKASDTLYSIARKYGVTIKELMEWNNRKDFTLSLGEKLLIKGGQ